MKSHLAIYNLNKNAARWPTDLKHTKKDAVKEIRWSNFRRISEEKYMYERFYGGKVKYFHELRMGSMTIDSFINIFFHVLHYVPYIKDKKVKIQHF